MIVDLKAIDQIIAIIKQDKNDFFEKFSGLEKQLESFVNRLRDDIGQLP